MNLGICHRLNCHNVGAHHSQTSSSCSNPHLILATPRFLTPEDISIVTVFFFCSSGEAIFQKPRSSINVAIHWLAEWPGRAGHFEMFVSGGGKKGSFSLNENNQTTTAFASTYYDSQHWQGLPIIHQTNTGMKWKPGTFQIIWWDSSAQKRSQDVSIYICRTCFMTLSNLSLIVIPNFSQLGCDCFHNTKRCRTAYPMINLKGHPDIGFPARGGGGGGGRRESMPSFFQLGKVKDFINPFRTSWPSSMSYYEGVKRPNTFVNRGGMPWSRCFPSLTVSIQSRNDDLFAFLPAPDKSPCLTNQ